MLSSFFPSPFLSSKRPYFLHYSSSFNLSFFFPFIYSFPVISHPNFPSLSLSISVSLSPSFSFPFPVISSHTAICPFPQYYYFTFLLHIPPLTHLFPFLSTLNLTLLSPFLLSCLHFLLFSLLFLFPKPFSLPTLLPALTPNSSDFPLPPSLLLSLSLTLSAHLPENG